MVSLLRCLAPRPIASLTLNGAPCISPITLRRRTSRSRLYENNPNKRFDIIFGTVQPGSDQLMSRVFRGPAASLLRTSAMLTRQHLARAPIPARVAEHLHLHLQQRRQPQQQRQLQLRLQQQLQLQLQLRLQLHQRQGRRLRQGLVELRHRGHSGIRNNFVGEADSFPYR